MLSHKTLGGTVSKDTEDRQLGTISRQSRKKLLKTQKKLKNFVSSEKTHKVGILVSCFCANLRQVCPAQDSNRCIFASQSQTLETQVVPTRQSGINFQIFKRTTQKLRFSICLRIQRIVGKI